MVLNSLSNFSFGGGESNYITIKSYGACWVKNIKYNVIYLKKQQIKDAVAYLLFNCYFIVSHKIFCQIIGFPMGLIQLLFLPNYSYIFMKVSE